LWSKRPPAAYTDARPILSALAIVPSGVHDSLGEKLKADVVPKLKLTARAVPKFADHELSMRVGVPNCRSHFENVWSASRIAEHDALVACTLVAGGDRALRNINRLPVKVHLPLKLRC
jgi:hypothetical protein